MLSQFIDAIIAIIKGFFWSSKAQEHEVKDAPAHPATVDSDSKLVADLERLRSQFGATDKDGVHNLPSGTPGPSPERKADSDAT